VLCHQYHVAKFLCDHTIVTDHHLIHNCLEIPLLILNGKKAFMVDIAIPGDAKCSLKEKQTHYTDLKIEVEKLWSVNANH